MITKTERKWNDPPLDNGFEKRWSIIGAVVYPITCLIAIGVAYLLGNPIVPDPFGILILIASPIIGAILFWSLAELKVFMKEN